MPNAYAKKFLDEGKTTIEFRHAQKKKDGTFLSEKE